MINLRKNRSYLNNLSEEERDYIKSQEVEDLLAMLFEQNGLNQLQSDLADGEIMHALLGIQTLTAAIENIAKITNRRVSEFDQLQSDIESKILSKLSEIKKQNEGKPIVRNTQPVAPNRVGDSFEKTILNQAMAMRRVGEAPVNLPIAQEHNIHNYTSGSDPYREPIE